jgi:hypothetical protein
MKVKLIAAIAAVVVAAVAVGSASASSDKTIFLRWNTICSSHPSDKGVGCYSGSNRYYAAITPHVVVVMNPAGKIVFKKYVAGPAGAGYAMQVPGSKSIFRKWGTVCVATTSAKAVGCSSRTNNYFVAISPKGVVVLDPHRKVAFSAFS